MAFKIAAVINSMFQLTLDNTRALFPFLFSAYFPSTTPSAFFPHFCCFLQMRWEMEVDEIEAVLDKIWDLHDKLSDAIHSISRTHFLNSIKNTTRKSDEFYGHRKKTSADDDLENKIRHGFVFVKEFRVDDDEAAVKEAKSLYAIRTALENLQDQLEFFHTVQIQQRAEKDAAIARLEQSRIILAMRLAEHQGKKYKVIEEAQALVGDVRDASHFVEPEHLYSTTLDPSSKSFKGKRNAIMNFFLSSFNLVSSSLKLDHTVGILGNAALVAISMIAFVHLNRRQYTYGYGDPHLQESRKGSHKSSTSSTPLDVKLARG